VRRVRNKSASTIEPEKRTDYLRTSESAAIKPSLRDEDRSEIVDVGESWARDDEISQFGEEAVGVVVVEVLVWSPRKRACALKGVRADKGARIILAAIDPVSICRRRPNPRFAIESELEFSVASSASLAADGDCRFAAREQYARRFSWNAIFFHGLCYYSEYFGDFASLALDCVAK
jgi:hypothetical protein